MINQQTDWKKKKQSLLNEVFDNIVSFHRINSNEMPRMTVQSATSRWLDFLCFPSDLLGTCHVQVVFANVGLGRATPGWKKRQNRPLKWIKPMIRPLTNRNNVKFMICQLGLGVFCESSVGMSSKPNGPTLETVSKKEKKSLGSSRSEKCSFAGEITKKQLVFLFKSIYCHLNKIPAKPVVMAIFPWITTIPRGACRSSVSLSHHPGS